MVLNKQNVFDDFIAGAEWLIKEGYTSSARLAMPELERRSARWAVMTQRPELFKVPSPLSG